MDPIRQKRIESEIIKILSTLIVYDKVKDPRVRMVSFHRAELSSDMEHAKVWVSSFCNAKERGDLLRGLKSAAGFFQSHISGKLKLRTTPKIQFIWDDNFLKGLEVIDLIDNLKPAPTSEEENK